MKKVLVMCLSVAMLSLTLQAGAASPETLQAGAASPELECSACNSRLALGELAYPKEVDWAALSGALKQANQDEHHVLLLEQFIDDGFIVSVEGSRLFDLGEGYMALMMPVFRGDEMGIVYSVSHPEEPTSVVASVYGSKKVTTTWVSEGELRSSDTELPSGMIQRGLSCGAACSVLTGLGCTYACSAIALNPYVCAGICALGAYYMCDYICSMEVGEPAAPRCGIPGLPDCCGIQPWPDCE